jgi:hypothetical protein
MMRQHLTTFATLLVSLLACSDPTFTACKNIPSGGCPGAGGTLNCEDPTCFGIYSCQQDGTWSFVAKCPAHEGGLDAESSGDGSLDAMNQAEQHAELRDANIDVPPGAAGGAGCMPPLGVELESPDCPLEQALACAASSCCGCQDLYVCADGGWNLWGECADGGALVTAPSP